MTTINPQVTALPETGSLEQLAGVPNAAELAALANSLFPELTDSIYDTQGYQPEKQSGTQAVNTGYVFGRTADFDWAHPFAYGGVSTDNWLNTVEAVSDPAAGYLQDAADSTTVVEPQTISYSPAVMSQEQAAQNNRAIDAPTSLGGDSVRKGGADKAAVSSSRDASIRIGSKTLAQIREDFPILSEQINGNRLVWLDNAATTRVTEPVLEKMDKQYEEAAYILGAGRKTTFFRVILSELRPALLTGFGLAFARGLGEYGSVIYISGNSAKEHTQVVSYVIMQKLNYID